MCVGGEVVGSPTKFENVGSGSNGRDNNRTAPGPYSCPAPPHINQPHWSSRYNKLLPLEGDTVRALTPHYTLHRSCT